jgi:hypothetical protein
MMSKTTRIVSDETVIKVVVGHPLWDAIKILAKAVLGSMSAQMTTRWVNGKQIAYCRYCGLKAKEAFQGAYFDEPHKDDCLYKQVKELADG